MKTSVPIYFWLIYEEDTIGKVSVVDTAHTDGLYCLSGSSSSYSKIQARTEHL